ncbi:hypothetical protein BN946_scf184803.g14 [Trametes cinnabarina]|uniref:Uncharacterized protein n=1 Tax=Pycnoporus cinnabarinus TaxID=5643 RepID=A0A060S6L5_PYCCI|nr:hypothetical protein BN946_scf184803.g14 [Trametes cinnabarina]
MQLLPYIYYGNRNPSSGQPARFTPFPVNTRGLFYYHRHPQIAFGGSIRFRVCQDPDPRYLDLGQDLLTEYGTPWQIPIIAIGRLPRFAILKSVLEQDKLITPKFWTEHKRLLDHAYDWRLGPHSQVIYECEQPFCMNLSSPHNAAYIATPRGLYILSSRKMMVPYIEVVQDDKQQHMEQWMRSPWPFEKGIFVCRLERPPGETAITTRVLRIHDPVVMSPHANRRVDTVDLPLRPREWLTVDRRRADTLLLASPPKSREDGVFRYLMQITASRTEGGDHGHAEEPRDLQA